MLEASESSKFYLNPKVKWQFILKVDLFVYYLELGKHFLPIRNATYCGLFPSQSHTLMPQLGLNHITPQTGPQVASVDSDVSLEMSKNNRSLGLGDIWDLYSKLQWSIPKTHLLPVWALAIGANIPLPTKDRCGCLLLLSIIKTLGPDQSSNRSLFDLLQKRE